MALDVGDGVPWLKWAEKAVVWGHVQAREAWGTRLPDKRLRGFRAMLVVIEHHSLSVQTPLHYVPAVLDAALRYQGMHLPYWRGQLEEVEREVRMLTRGYEGITTEVLRYLLRSPMAYYREEMPTAGEAYRAHTARALNRMCHTQEEVVRRVFYQSVAEVQKEENMCPRFVWYRRMHLMAGERERMRPVLQALLPAEEHVLVTNRRCRRGSPILVLDTDFGGAAHGTVRRVKKEGMTIVVMHVHKKDTQEYQRAGLHNAEVLRDRGNVEQGVYKLIMRQARGHELCGRWKRETQRMWKEWVAKWGITEKAKRRSGEGGGAREEAPGRVAGEKARPGILLCAPLGLKGQGEQPDFDLQSCPFHCCERRNVNKPKSLFTA